MNVRIKELEGLITYHKALYYQGRPEIDDFHYDKLEDELRELDPDNPILSIVGAIVDNAGKLAHDKKMLSLNKTYRLKELLDWANNKEIISTFKIDGVSCSLLYEDGKIRVGKTRGDGSVGENITSRVLWVNTVPRTIKIKGKLEIRGELYCSLEQFIKLSAEMITLGLEKPSNPRNIVAGFMGRKDNLELCRFLNFKAFDIISDDLNLNKEEEKTALLNELGFDASEIIIHRNKETIEEVIQTAKEFMEDGAHLIDGIVFSYNDLALHEELGETAHHPRYKMAFKFEGESKATIIKKIEWSVSRNGILTPVANVKPVELSGAKISRVTLHNFGLVKLNQLKVGDTIQIIRSGEVIPKFVAVEVSSDNPFVVPTECPVCKSSLIEDEIRLICSNIECPARIKEVILNFIQKIGIDDLSSKRLDEMILKQIVSTIPDLFKLEKEDLFKLDKVKEKLADKLFHSIQSVKNPNLVKFLSSLGITGGAFNKCERIVNAGHNSIEKIKSLTVEKLCHIEGFAEKSAEDFLSSLKEKFILIDELIDLGFKFEAPKEIIQSELTGKKVCITGTLSQKRNIIEESIRNSGGLLVSSVTKNTDYLLTNDKESGSSKAKKAKEIGVKIINEEDLQAIL